MRLSSVPAYSIPKSGRDRWGKEIVPGPADYNNNDADKLSVHVRLPRATMNKAGLRGSQNSHATPGPADYSNEYSSLSKRGQAMIGGEKREFNLGKDGLPGPGDYETYKSSLNKRL